MVGNQDDDQIQPNGNGQDDRNFQSNFVGKTFDRKVLINGEIRYFVSHNQRGYYCISFTISFELKLMIYYFILSV